MFVIIVVIPAVGAIIVVIIVWSFCNIFAQFIELVYNCLFNEVFYMIVLVFLLTSAHTYLYLKCYCYILYKYLFYKTSVFRSQNIFGLNSAATHN